MLYTVLEFAGWFFIAAAAVVVAAMYFRKSYSAVLALLMTVLLLAGLAGINARAIASDFPGSAVLAAGCAVSAAAAASVLFCKSVRKNRLAATACAALLAAGIVIFIAGGIVIQRKRSSVSKALYTKTAELILSDNTVRLTAGGSGKKEVLFCVRNHPEMLGRISWRKTEEKPEMKHTRVINVEEKDSGTPGFRCLTIYPESIGTALIELGGDCGLSEPFYSVVFVQVVPSEQ